MMQMNFLIGIPGYPSKADNAVSKNNMDDEIGLYRCPDSFVDLHYWPQQVSERVGGMKCSWALN